MSVKNARTVLFVSLVAITLAFSISGVGLSHADLADESKPDLDLLNEAEKIEAKYDKEFKYDEDGDNKEDAKSIDEKRHEELVKELNSRGIYHEPNTRY